MNALKIALLQIEPCNTLEGNLKKGIQSCRRAKDAGADLSLIHSEMCIRDRREGGRAAHVLPGPPPGG